MSSDSINNSAELSGELSSLNIGNNDSEETITICANCGKEGGDNMNSCNKCDLVKYCNVACKKKHKSKHKKKCKKRAAELHDEALFKEPTRDECPICMLLFPLYDTQPAQLFAHAVGNVSVMAVNLRWMRVERRASAHFVSRRHPTQMKRRLKE